MSPMGLQGQGSLRAGLLEGSGRTVTVARVPVWALGEGKACTRPVLALAARALLGEEGPVCSAGCCPYARVPKEASRECDHGFRRGFHSWVSRSGRDSVRAPIIPSRPPLEPQRNVRSFGCEVG